MWRLCLHAKAVRLPPVYYRQLCVRRRRQVGPIKLVIAAHLYCVTEERFRVSSRLVRYSARILRAIGACNWRTGYPYRDAVSSSPSPPAPYTAIRIAPMTMMAAPGSRCGTSFSRRKRNAQTKEKTELILNNAVTYPTNPRLYAA